jgi:hypothetical protein
VIAFNEGSTALVVNCELGPCLLGGIAAGTKTKWKEKKMIGKMKKK